jgi:hypothetical protein
MEEPSVLDFVKSRLTFWKKSALQLPAAPGEDRTGEDQLHGDEFLAPDEPSEGDDREGTSPEIRTEAEMTAVVSAAPEARPLEKGLAFPWLAFMALVLGIIAQRSLDPSANRDWKLGTVLYLAAVGLAIWSYIRKQWQFPSLPADSDGNMPLTYRPAWLIAGGILGVGAFLLFGRRFLPWNDTAWVFAPLNTTFWVGSIAATIWGLWESQPGGLPWYRRAWNFLLRPSWSISLTRGAVALLAVTAVILFFRFYRMDGVPSEMVSDHAEKLLDVNDVLSGQLNVFFPRNTGREAFQFYLTAAIILIFKTGLSFTSLKIGTIMAGVCTLPYIYRIGKEWGSPRAGLLALLFAGVAYWPNVVSRFGLRFPLYPLFVAPTLYYLFRGLRDRRRNDFIFAGIALGIGLHGYSPIRILPFVVVAVVGLYLLHRQAKGARRETIYGLVILSLVALVFFLPLGSYAADNPEMVNYRALTRISTTEKQLDAPPSVIFIQNLWNAMTMFFWSDGEVWVHSIPNRPALDTISAPLLMIGMAFMAFRYFKKKHWFDLVLLLSIPMLMLPSILSLAFPNENPSLNRTDAAIVPVFVIIGLALDGLLSAIEKRGNAQESTLAAPRPAVRRSWTVQAAIIGLVLSGLVVMQNYDLVFNQYAEEFSRGAWNTDQIGGVMSDFIHTIGSRETAWTVAYAYWVDTRLVGVNAGYVNWDTSIWPDHFADTLADPRAKLFIINPQDTQSVAALKQMYPRASISLHTNPYEGKNFLVMLVPAAVETGQ